MPSDFTDKWTTAAASQIDTFINAALTAEREACANIAEKEPGTCGCATRIAAKIRERKLSDNEVLRNSP
jgi:hypothetical protein